MKKQIFLYIWLLLLWILNFTVFTSFAFDSFDSWYSSLDLTSKDYSLSWNNYTFYYSDGHNVIWLNSLDNSVKEIKELFNILNNNNIFVKSYVLQWNSLKDYSFSTKISDYYSNWFSFSYFMNKYASDKNSLLDVNPFTVNESQSIITSIIKWVFYWFYEIKSNNNTFNSLVDNLSTKLFFIKDNNVNNNVIVSDTFLNNLYNVFYLEFSSKVNNHLKYYYKTKESLLWTKNIYLDLDYNDIYWSYTWKLDLINQNYNILVNIINQNYDIDEINNIDNNILWKNIDIDNKVISAKNFSKTDFPNIFNSDTKVYLFNDLNEIRTQLINDLDNYKQYLIDKKTNEQNSTSSWSINYSNWINTSSWVIDFEYYSNDSNYNSNSIWSWIIDYTKQSWSWTLYNLDDFQSNDSKDIVKLLNNYNVNLWEKIDSREDYWIALANNIDRYSTLQNFVSWSTILNNELFIDWINYYNILTSDIKNNFLNISDLHTVKDINLQSINNNIIDQNNWLYLLRNELSNYWKLLMNNQFINNTILLPISSKVNNEYVYKNYLKGNKWSYYDNYNKNTYTQIQERTDVEWLLWLSFWYIPSPEQIKDNNNIIWIKLWNNSHYYLNDSNDWIEINLDDWYDYDVKIKTYNWSTSWLSLSLVNINNIIPIILKWEIISKSNWKIKSKIVDSKNEDDSIHSLYVNDILYK
jgi:hypothetical protein